MAGVLSRVPRSELVLVDRSGLERGMNELRIGPRHVVRLKRQRRMTRLLLVLYLLQFEREAYLGLDSRRMRELEMDWHWRWPA